MGVQPQSGRGLEQGEISRLWDGPTRVVHWGLVGLTGFSWWAGETRHMDWHRWSGYGVLGLFVFRLIWGLAGSQSARFVDFVKGPVATLAYMRTLPRRDVRDMPGHNPLGAWSVLALLLLLAVQIGTGLFSVDVDGVESGPMSDRVGFDAGRLAARLHHWSFTALEALVAVHVAAVLFYLLYKRSNLVGPMITGCKRFAEPPALAFAPRWRLAAAILVAAGVAWWASMGFRI
jgi:cytochrome b